MNQLTLSRPQRACWSTHLEPAGAGPCRALGTVLICVLSPVLKHLSTLVDGLLQRLPVLGLTQWVDHLSTIKLDVARIFQQRSKHGFFDQPNCCVIHYSPTHRNMS